MMRFALKWIAIGVVTCGGTGLFAEEETLPEAKTELVADEPMNFIFFLVDDLGWADLGCFGSTFYQTPNIDALADSGMRFTNGYAACPVCSPTRASIMTGRHPVRVDITDWIPGMNIGRVKDARFKQVEDRDNLALSEVTIAEALKAADYSTFFAGKWHLGDKGHWPEDQGFDVNVGGNAKGSPPGGYYSPWTNPTLQARKKGEYLTERLTEESMLFLEKQATRKKTSPFLLFLSYYNVHTPITPYRKKQEYYQALAADRYSDQTPFESEHQGFSRLRQDNSAYGSMVSAVDDSVGAILKKLRQLDLTKKTTIIFFSDNGGLCTLGGKRGPTSNFPLRSGKGWLYEGGIREPMIVRVPGMTQAKSVCHVPVVSMDFFPTILELAGLDSAPQLHADGLSLTSLLRDSQSGFPDRDLFWHYPHYHGSTWKPGASVRSGDWKMIQFYHDQKQELYDLRKDPGERNDLSTREPQVMAKMDKLLGDWQTRMNARMPQPQ